MKNKLLVCVSKLSQNGHFPPLIYTKQIANTFSHRSNLNTDGDVISKWETSFTHNLLCLIIIVTSFTIVTTKK